VTVSSGRESPEVSDGLAKQINKRPDKQEKGTTMSAETETRHWEAWACGADGPDRRHGEKFRAATSAEAREEAERWLAEVGSATDGTKTRLVRGRMVEVVLDHNGVIIGDVGEEYDLEVTAYPEEPDCVDGHGHDWRRRVGGQETEHGADADIGRAHGRECPATCVRCGCCRLVLEDEAVEAVRHESRGDHGRRRVVDCDDMVRRAVYDAIEKAKLRGTNG
jgi:hypothetical protein